MVYDAAVQSADGVDLGGLDGAAEAHGDPQNGDPRGGRAEKRQKEGVQKAGGVAPQQRVEQPSLGSKPKRAAFVQP